MAFESSEPSEPYDRAIAAAESLQQSMKSFSHHQTTSRTAQLTEADLARLSLTDEKRGTVLYLAYGSNLSVEKFRGSRGIRPLSQINVQVPSLRLTFDLPGIPYTEPCFANSGRRDPDHDPSTELVDISEKAALIEEGYHKDNWHKGLIGVVYEVTPEDYAHIIATEGGGSGYQDITVDCHPFATSDPERPVPQTPTTTSFKAHTLFAPSLPKGSKPPKHGGRIGRNDPSYAQPSARYLKLITDGAAELALPYEYQEYLNAIRPYRITTMRQRAGKAVLTATWIPIIMFIFALGRLFADEHGLLPAWLRQVSGAIFKAVWISYDFFLKPLFGEGERSIPDGGQSAAQEQDYSFDASVHLTEPPAVLQDVDVEKIATQTLI